MVCVRRKYLASQLVTDLMASYSATSSPDPKLTETKQPLKDNSI